MGDATSASEKVPANTSKMDALSIFSSLCLLFASVSRHEVLAFSTPIGLSTNSAINIRMNKCHAPTPVQMHMFPTDIVAVEYPRLDIKLSDDLVTSLPAFFVTGTILVAISIFLYANLVYTPEIASNAAAMRAEENAAKMVDLVEELRSQKRTGEAKESVEKALGVTVEQYIQRIDDRIAAEIKGEGRVEIAVSKAERTLAQLLRSVYSVD